MWKIFQASIVVAVMLSDGTYHWSTGPMVAPVCAIGAAWLATALIFAVKDWTKRLSRVAVRLKLKEPAQQSRIQRMS